jgi:hypothetical protein
MRDGAVGCRYAIDVIEFARIDDARSTQLLDLDDREPFGCLRSTSQGIQISLQPA